MNLYYNQHKKQLMKKINFKYHFLYILIICTLWVFELSAQQNIKILSYNILKGMSLDTTQGKETFVEWVKIQDPDIFAIQEANNFTKKSLQEMAQKFNHPYTVLLRERGFPVAITSKYPIENINRITDNMWHGFITAKILDYNIVVLHLSPREYLKRREEIDIILKYIASNPSKKKWIVMGDFNSLSPLDKDNYIDGKEIKSLQDNNKTENLIDGKQIDYEVQQKILDFGLIDVVKKHSNSVKLSSVVNRSRRIDYIYVSKDISNNIVKAEILKDEFTHYYSDHFPIIMEMKKCK